MNRDQLHKPKFIFLTFGGGSTSIQEAASRVAMQARSMGIFDEVVLSGPQHLTERYWASFHSDWHTKRGFGYWAWKSFVVSTILDQMNDGDFLYYADAGCELNERGKSRLLEYAGIAENCGGVLAFRQNYKHSQWCKEELAALLPFGLEAGQVSASFFVLKKNSLTIKLVRDWWDLSSRDWGLLIDDTTSDQRPEFREHRHDQAIFHALLAKENIELVSPDETFMTPWHDFGEMPVLAVRNRTGNSLLPELIGSKPTRCFRKTIRLLFASVKKLGLAK